MSQHSQPSANRLAYPSVTVVGLPASLFCESGKNCSVSILALTSPNLMAFWREKKSITVTIAIKKCQTLF